MVIEILCPDNSFFINKRMNNILGHYFNQNIINEVDNYTGLRQNSYIEHVFRPCILWKNFEGLLDRQDLPAIISLYNNRQLKYKAYFWARRCHVEITKNIPAITEYFENGNIKSCMWYSYGYLHRQNGPAHIEYYSSGRLKYEQYWQMGKRHRDIEPAIINYFENGQIQSMGWYQNGKAHRDKDPGMIVYYNNGQIKSQCYWVDDDIHRDDDDLTNDPKPAYIKYDEHGHIILRGYWKNSKSIYHDNNL